MIKRYINSLVAAFIKNGFISNHDRVYYKNIVSGVLGVVNDSNERASQTDVAELFNLVGDYASQHTTMLKEQAIDFISALLIPTPSQLEHAFFKQASVDPQKAWDEFYKKAKQAYYIKYDCLQKNIEWESQISNLQLQITINLSKPEKTIEEIKRAKALKNSQYPQCAICFENLGFFGTNESESRQNIRFINQKFGSETFFMHFSPYGYFDHHLVVNSKRHVPIQVSPATFKQQLDFVSQYPFYFIGLNADLPIVGGSILSHAHFQGGKGDFPIFKTKPLKTIKSNDLLVQILDWPVSIIKLSSKNQQAVFAKSIRVRDSWYSYNNAKLGILANHNQKRQNAITTMVRFQNGTYEVYIALRNNGVSKAHPKGIFHFHKDKWNIKKENIGLIEMAGKAILPGRLKRELEEIKRLLEDDSYKPKVKLGAHKDWIAFLRKEYAKTNQNPGAFIENQVALLFYRGLKDCGVFYNQFTEFEKFVEGI